MIDAVIRDEIKRAVATARENPTSPEAVRAGAVSLDKPVMELSDRKPGQLTKRGVNVVLGTVRAAISFEYQPLPVGLCKHLSISTLIPEPGRMPPQIALVVVAKEFGFNLDDERYAREVWLEEYEPGCHAINLVESDEPVLRGG